MRSMTAGAQRVRTGQLRERLTMALNDWLNKVREALTRVTKDSTRRPDGGTSHYRPVRNRDAGYTDTQAGQEAYSAQPVTYAHTGFTGMNPPQTDYYQQPQQDPRSANQMTGWGTPAQQPDYSRYGQMPPMNDPRGAEYTQGAQPAGGYPAQQAGYPAWGQNAAEAQSPAARPERGWFPQRENRTAPNNITYMPGVTPEGGFTHVEHIMTMTGMKSCYEAIECMRNGETLIITMDAIANEGERLRCQDMLAGAAFTLGCNVRMLNGAGVVLIAPENVRILPENSMRNEMAAPPEYAPVAAPQEAPYTGRRERRSSPNMADWTAAQNGKMDNYNPYTGTMPAAAGAYGSFGGYGV